MKDSNVLRSIKVAFNESKELLEDASEIKTTMRIDDVKAPVSFNKTGFGSWLLSEGTSFIHYPRFKQIPELHQKIYDQYSSLYASSQKVSDTNDKINLMDNYYKFEKLVTSFHDHLETAKKGILESTSNQAMEELNIILQENMDLLDKAPTNSYSTEYLDVQAKLKEEIHKKQQLKKELIEQEIKQVTERQNLFIKAVDQQVHHYQLILQESKFTSSKYENQVAEIVATQKEKSKELESIKNKKVATQDELDQLELSNATNEEHNDKEIKKENDKLKDFDQHQEICKAESSKLLKHKNRKQVKLEKLQQQVLQAEKDLDNLIADESKLHIKEKTIKEKKSQVRLEIKEKLNKQKQKRDEDIALEESKYQHLKQLKKQYYSMQHELIHLEHEQQNLIAGKQEFVSYKEQELAELERQQQNKQNMLDILNIELHQKKSELKELIEQTRSINSNLVKQGTESQRTKTTLIN